jgi:hypothetical protein
MSFALIIAPPFVDALFLGRYLTLGFQKPMNTKLRAPGGFYAPFGPLLLSFSLNFGHLPKLGEPKKLKRRIFLQFFRWFSAFACFFLQTVCLTLGVS